MQGITEGPPAPDKSQSVCVEVFKVRVERNLLDSRRPIVESTARNQCCSAAASCNQITKSETATRRNSNMRSSTAVTAHLRVAVRLHAARAASPLEWLLLLKVLEKYTMTASVERWHLIATY